MAYASLDTCGWKGKNQIVPTGKGQYQLGKKHYSQVAKGASPNRVKRIKAKGQTPFSLKLFKESVWFLLFKYPEQI